MRRVELLIALSILGLAGTVQEDWTAQPASRFLLTEAVADHGTLTLDQHTDLLGVDHARYEGHYYSDKAPYQPLLGVPFYKAFRAVGGDAFPIVDGQPDPITDDGPLHWSRWWVSLWTATVPAILLCIVVRRLVHQVHPEVATPVALALSLGTILLPFAGLLFGHVLSALFAAGAWLIVRRPTVTPASMFIAGLLLSGAVGSDYPVAVPAAVVVVAGLLAHGLRPTLILTAGGVLGALPLMLYNWLAFESPFSTAYQGHLPNFQGSGALGVYNLVAPQGDELRRSLVGDRGLFTLAPICAVAVLFAVVAVTRRTPARRDGVMAIIILVAMWLMSAGIDGYGGATPGPRYLIIVLPFLAVPLAEAWNRVPVTCTAAAVFGTAVMVLATLTDPLVPSGTTGALGRWLRRAAEGDVSRSIPGELVGDWGLYALMALGLAAAVAAVMLDRERRPA